MGACATKPKVLKDDAEAPAQGPEQAVTEEKDAPAVLVKEENKVVETELDVEAAGDDKEESLSSLLKEDEAEVVTELPREPEAAPAPAPAPDPVKQETEIPPVVVEAEKKPQESE